MDNFKILLTKNWIKFKVWITPKNSDIRTFATRATITYFITLTVLCVLLFPFLKLPSSYNELGDFLAGTFSPVAFFWLVIGYLMQHSELNLNRKSLDQQISEFKKSIRISEKNSRRDSKKNSNDLEMMYFKSQPLFELSDDVINSSNESSNIDIYLKSHKNDCYDLEVLGQEGEKISDKITIFKTEKFQELTISITPKEILDVCRDTLDEIISEHGEGLSNVNISAFQYKLSYIDELGIRRKLDLNFSLVYSHAEVYIKVDLKNYSRSMRFF